MNWKFKSRTSSENQPSLKLVFLLSKLSNELKSKSASVSKLVFDTHSPAKIPAVSGACHGVCGMENTCIRCSPKAHPCTKGRHVGRISVTAFALLAFIALTVLLLYNVAAARIDRQWPGSSMFNFTANDMYDFSDGSTRLCPCGTMATSWAHYVTFFSLLKDPSGTKIIREARITDGDKFCNASSNFNSTTGNHMGCVLMFNSVVNKDIAQTWFPTAYVLLPSQLNEILWNYMISNPKNSWQPQRDHSSSDADFWEAAKSMRTRVIRHTVIK